MDSGSVIAAQIERFGENVTLRTVTNSYSDWGDATATTSDTTIKAVYNDIVGDEQFNKDGRYQSGDKVFFCKSTQTGLAVGNRIIWNSETFEIKDVVRHRLSGANTVFEVRCGKII